jgi:DNA-binding protein H-NS
MGMTENELQSMSVDELWEFHEMVADILATKMLAEKKSLEARLKQLQLNSAQAAQTGRRPYPEVRPKFRNPEIPSETWSGRGKTPRWLSRLLKSGKNLDDYLIAAEAN